MGVCCSKAAVAAGEMTVLVIGLDNSGKTTFTMALNDDPDPFVVPTVGFSAPIKKKLFGSDVVFYDLGGGVRIRGIWPSYFADVHGVVYVVDAADRDRMKESATELRNSLTHPMVIGKPLLVLANKQDLPGAATSAEVTSLMELSGMASLSRHHVQACTAKPTAVPGGKLDPRIAEGLRWLVEAVRVDYPQLSGRVQREMAESKAADDARRKKSREDFEAKQAAKEKDKENQGGASTGAATDSKLAGTSETSAAPAKTSGAAAVPQCVSCKAAPAARRCAAVGWQAVCEPCGTRLDAEAAAKKAAELAEEAARLGVEEDKNDGPAASMVAAPSQSASPSAGAAVATSAAQPAEAAAAGPAEPAAACPAEPAVTPAPAAVASEPAIAIAPAPAVAASSVPAASVVPTPAAASPAAADVAPAGALSAAAAAAQDETIDAVVAVPDSAPEAAPAPIASSSGNAAAAPSESAAVATPAQEPVAAAAAPVAASKPALALPRGVPACAVCKEQAAARRAAVPATMLGKADAAPDAVVWSPVCASCGDSIESARLQAVNAKLKDFVPVETEEAEAAAAAQAQAAAGR